jgi:DNA-directed RNA polymerase subunit RPC12/RpoP
MNEIITGSVEVTPTIMAHFTCYYCGIGLTSHIDNNPNYIECPNCRTLLQKADRIYRAERIVKSR